MTTPVIKVEGLGKRYQLQRSERRSYRTLRESLQDWVRSRVRSSNQDLHSRTEDFWALQNVSFEVQSGEVLGIIGRNGAGKSTLLKILSRITEPTQGRIRLRGRVSSLLEVGTGFHPELTGRENIFLNGAMMGMKKKEIAARFDEIVAFAEIDPFLDTPVKRYSSGMYVRLAFAVAAHLEPEILIVDEVLAVGDAEFQKKCLGRIGKVAKNGRTVLFVSHNLSAVRSLCTRAILLQNGSIRGDGPVEDVLGTYTHAFGETKSADWTRTIPSSKDLFFESISAHLTDAGQLACVLRLRATQQTLPCLLALDICEASGLCLMQTMPSQEPIIGGDPGFYEIGLQVHLPDLIPGHYLIDAWIGPHFTQTLDHIRQAVSFEVTRAPQSDRKHPYTSDHGFIAPPSQALVSFKTCAPRD